MRKRWAEREGKKSEGKDLVNGIAAIDVGENKVKGIALPRCRGTKDGAIRHVEKVQILKHEHQGNEHKNGFDEQQDTPRSALLLRRCRESHPHQFG